MGNIVDQTPRAPQLDGFSDDALAQPIVEALKVLAARKDEYDRAVRSLDTQYLKALEASHDGDSPKCKQVLAQVAAVRQLF
jgi:hypothetical protein